MGRLVAWIIIILRPQPVVKTPKPKVLGVKLAECSVGSEES